MGKNKTTDPKEKLTEEEVLSCPVIFSLAVFGGKWKPAILYMMERNGTLRFGELKRQVTGITQKMLTNQLRELEADGVVSRKVYAEVPPRVEYALTEYGDTLRPVLHAMAEWGSVHRELKSPLATPPNPTST